MAQKQQVRPRPLWQNLFHRRNQWSSALWSLVFEDASYKWSVDIVQKFCGIPTPDWGGFCDFIHLTGKSLCPGPGKSRRSHLWSARAAPHCHAVENFPLRWIKSQNPPQSGLGIPQNFFTMSTDHLHETSSKIKFHSPLVSPVEGVLCWRSWPPCCFCAIISVNVYSTTDTY